MVDKLFPIIASRDTDVADRGLLIIELAVLESLGFKVSLEGKIFNLKRADGYPEF